MSNWEAGLSKVFRWGSSSRAIEPKRESRITRLALRFFCTARYDIVSLGLRLLKVFEDIDQEAH